MADAKIRGITIELGADTTGLKKALKGINAEVSTTQKELKDVERLLKLDPSNVELLEQKQRLLNKQTENYETKLKALKSAQEKFAEAAANGDEKAAHSYEVLQREIISTEDYLKKAKTAANSFNVEAEKMSASLNKVSEKASLVAEKTKAISAAGAAVAGSLGAMAVKAMTTADDLNTLAAQTGFSTEELQKFGYAADRVDVSTETITSALKKMKSGMASGGKALNELGIATTNADGSMRSATEVFYDALEALSQIENETERDTTAMAIFGRGADELATIIDDGGQKLRQLGEEAEKSGKILSQESLDAANAVNDLVDGLKADVSQTILVTGAKALEAATPVIEKTIGAVGSLLNWLGSLDESTIAIIGTVALAVAAISPVAGLIAKVTSAVSGLMAILPLLTPIIGAVTAAAPWLALAAAVAAIVIAIIKNWDAVKAAALKLWESINNGLIQPIKDGFENLKEKLIAVWDTITGRIKDNVNMLIGFVNGAINAINALTRAANNSVVGKALGLNIGEIGTIPAMANGGTISSGSALVGEAGAELLTVNNGRATVTPLTNNTYNTYNQLSSNPIQVSLMLDRTVLAREMVQANARAVSLAGGSCIK